MYQWERDRTQTNYNKRVTTKLKQFQLNTNYCSHDGILRLFSSVIDLIHHFFPDSIDSLLPERSKVDGPLPIVFEELEAKTVFSKVFLVDERRANYIELGTEQVII